MKPDWYRCDLTDLKDPDSEIRRSRNEAYHYFLKGLSKRKAAQKLLLHERTVGRWYERFEKEGAPRQWDTSRGAKVGHRITGGAEDLAGHLKAVVLKSPSEFGLPGEKWTATSLASYLEARYGIRPSQRSAYRYLALAKGA